MVEDLRMLLREFAGRKSQPTAMILDSRTLQSTPESGARGGYDGAKRRKGSKVHAAVDTLGHLLALHVTAADEQDRTQVEKLAEAVQEITGKNIELAYVDQGYTGDRIIRLYGFVLIAMPGVLDKARAEERDDHCKCECSKEIFTYPRKKYHGKEDNGRAESCRQHGELNFFAAFLGGFNRVEAHLEVAEDVFEYHDRVVDKAR